IICETGMELYRALEILPAPTMEQLVPTEGEELARWQKRRADIAAAGFQHGKYEGDELQLPAFFLVDATGVIEKAHYARNLMDMPNIDEILAML
ncbi:MAG: AhpC/TSA family protein, partial [Oscillospiraceae bacterium]|nr:AhpC/TSA family protein [Oscillospiraceae bacterium]